jgi:phospholipase/lecithinase/hemolysin
MRVVRYRLQWPGCTNRTVVTLNMLKNFLCASLLAVSMATGASASPYTQFVVFGDSLSDPGNASAMTGANFPPSPPYAGPFSNGPTAAQYLSQSLGVPVQLGWPVANAGSNNFAVGGARNGIGNYNVEINNPAGLGAAFPALAQTGIQRQIERYAGQHPAVPSPAGTLFMVWGGPNDIFLGAETGADPSLYIPAALNDLANDLLMLVGMGAQHILVPGMADLGLTPQATGLGPATAAGLSALSAAYNGGLTQMLGSLESALAPLGVDFYGFDTAGFFSSVTASPAAFGFTNTTDSCVSLVSCEGYLYFDGVHPTTAAHRLLAAQFAVAAGVPEPATWALVLLALLPLALGRRQAVAA